MYIEPPHAPHDRSKLAQMIKALRRGEKLPPVLLHQNQAYSGSHRIAAWEAMGMDVDYVEIDDNEYGQIMASQNLDPMYDSVCDFEPFLDEAIEMGIAGLAK